MSSERKKLEDARKERQKENDKKAWKKIGGVVLTVALAILTGGRLKG